MSWEGEMNPPVQNEREWTERMENKKDREDTHESNTTQKRKDTHQQPASCDFLQGSLELYQIFLCASCGPDCSLREDWFMKRRRTKRKSKEKRREEKTWNAERRTE